MNGELAFYQTSGRKDFAELLKNGEVGKPLLVRSDVESIKSSVDKDSKTVITDIKFKPAAFTAWAEATKRNLNKLIAIAIDNKVFYTPVVKVVIVSGLCEVTGDFTSK